MRSTIICNCQSATGDYVVDIGTNEVMGKIKKNKYAKRGRPLGRSVCTWGNNIKMDIIWKIYMIWFDIWYDIYLTAIMLTHGGSSTVHNYKQYIEQHNRHKTIHRTTQFTNFEECGPCPVFARYTLAFALQLRKKHGKTSVRVAGECQLAKNIQNRA